MCIEKFLRLILFIYKLLNLLNVRNIKFWGTAGTAQRVFCRFFHVDALLFWSYVTLKRSNSTSQSVVNYFLYLKCICLWNYFIDAMLSELYLLFFNISYFWYSINLIIFGWKSIRHRNFLNNIYLKSYSIFFNCVISYDIFFKCSSVEYVFVICTSIIINEFRIFYCNWQKIVNRLFLYFYMN